MNKLERLIADLCPDGVEFRHMWEITTWDKRFIGIERYKQPTFIKYNYLLANDLKNLATDSGDVKLLYTGVSDSGVTTEELAGENLCEGEIVAIPWGGSPRVQYHKGKFVTADNRIATSNDRNILDNKFLFYWMNNEIKLLCSFYRGSGIQHPSMSKVLNMFVPLPPLPIQQEIVRILDKFTTLEAELEAELVARTKQYEYYRDELLTFGDEVEWTTLGKIAQYANTRTKASKVTSENYVGVDNLLPDKLGKGLSNYVPNEGSLIEYQIDDILIGNIRPYLKKIWLAANDGGTNGDVLTVRIKNEAKNILSPTYLYYVLASDDFFNYDMQHSKGAKMPRGDKSSVMKYLFPIPPLSEQERIVAILDRFDALVNDISQGLPAEIAARRKQYEYYRDKLLTFKERQ